MSGDGQGKKQRTPIKNSLRIWNTSGVMGRRILFFVHCVCKYAVRDSTLLDAFVLIFKIFSDPSYGFDCCVWVFRKDEMRKTKPGLKYFSPSTVYVCIAVPQTWGIFQKNPSSATITYVCTYVHSFSFSNRNCWLYLPRSELNFSILSIYISYRYSRRRFIAR